MHNCHNHTTTTICNPLYILLLMSVQNTEYILTFTRLTVLLHSPFNVCTCIKARAKFIYRKKQQRKGNFGVFFFILISMCDLQERTLVPQPIVPHTSLALLLGHWYEIMALYYVKSILKEISASRQDRRVLQKSKIIRIEFLSKWGMLQTSRYV